MVTVPEYTLANTFDSLVQCNNEYYVQGHISIAVIHRSRSGRGQCPRREVNRMKTFVIVKLW